MKKHIVESLCFCLLSLTALGQQPWEGPHASHRLGFMDTARIVPIWAMARTESSAEETIRYVPHQETIVYLAQDNQFHSIGQIDNALRVCMMERTQAPSGHWTLYFASVHANGKLEYYQYDLERDGPFRDIGDTELLPPGLKLLKKLPPNDVDKICK